MDSFDIFGRAIVEELQHRLSRNGYNNVVYCSGDQPEVGDDLEVTNAATAGTDGMNQSREASGLQGPDPQRASFYRGG
jgi:hypothetical protein